MFSGEYKNKINQIGVQKTGVPKMQNSLKTNNLCGATYDYLDLQNGRIYNFQGSLKYVQADSAIGSYFFQNGAHDKFGVPKTDENVSLFFYSQEFFNRVNIQLYWPGSAYATKPLDEIYCPGQEPVCGNGKVENKESCDPKEDKQCSLDCKTKCEGLKVWDSEKKECVKEPVCGDGEVDTGETCDDGNIVDGDQCSLDCKNVCVEPEVWSGAKCGVCPEGQVMEGGVCIDQKEYECKTYGLTKFTDSAGEIACGKFLWVPYFNQYLKKDGTGSEPAEGNLMCGAASATMVAGYFGKLQYDTSNQYDLKRYMYSDQGENLGNPCEDLNKAGVFAVTQYLCNQSYLGGIQNYLTHKGLTYETKWHVDYDFEIAWNFIKDSIDAGFPVIIAYAWRNDSWGGHVTVIKGYIDDKKTGRREFIMNDSFTNTSVHGIANGFNLDGENATYSLWTDNWLPTYMIRVKN